MSSSNTFKCFLAGLLLLSIGWKVTITFHHNYAFNQNGILDLLRRNHFVVDEQLIYGVSIVQAQQGSCQIQIANLEPDGSNHDLVRHLLTVQDRFFVVYRGRVYAQQPIFWTVINTIWLKHLYDLGFINQIAPVIAVAADAACDAERLPWAELRQIS